ncbi:PAS domain-containing protein [Hymenobacter weizhouensis]|uniref:PAS domain-containing protein n=1 Tax=Hymenobacter sp. YIM 151500-1 TaxID=2987689 RepID=UPI0022264535|nr:PAS domain-containing protein [Hymenobacter sp. YIM 151500-1]UYZ65105.1 PAS domain-containing protein [Hymenobacter sp. YIM 151500-1]
MNSESTSNYERLHTAVEAAGIGTWDLNLLTGELLWSDRCKELFGLPPTATVDYARFLAGLHPDDRARTDAVVAQALDPAGTGEYDIEYRTVGLEDGGRLRWVRATGRVFFNEDRTQALRFIGTITDITEAKRRSLHLQRLLESDVIGVLFWDLNSSRVLDANDQYLRLIGYTREELQAGLVDWRALTPPEGMAEEERIIAELRRTGTHRPFEKEYVLRDGRRVPVLLAGSLLEPGGTEGVSFCLDSSEQKSTAARLAASEQEFRMVTEYIPQLVWLTDPTGFHTYFNQRWIDFTGYTLKDSIGSDMWNNLLHPDDRQRARQRWGHSLATGEFYEIEYRFKAKDDSYRWFLGQALPVRDEAGYIVKWFGTCTDIHDQKLQEFALREREAEFMTLANAIPQLAWMADETGSIFWYNDRWFRFTGTTLDQMRGWGWQQVHDPNHVERVTEGFRAAVASGEKWEDTFPLRRHDGEYRWFLSRALPVHNEAGQVVRWCGTNTDVTEQKQLQDQLERAYSDLEAKVMFRTLDLEREVQELRRRLGE